MPVYNEEPYVAQSIGSLLEQDYRNFELIVADNASTDRTPQIISQLAAKDRRIALHVSDRNLGSLANFEKVLRLSRGKYFMFASGHDLWQPNFISRAVDVLEENQEVILSAPGVVIVDKTGRTLTRINGNLDTRNTPPKERFSQAMRWGAPYHFLAYGLVRSDALRKQKWRRDVLCSDVILIAELSLEGAFLQAQGTTLFSMLNHPKMSWVDSYYSAFARLGLPSKTVPPNASRYLALTDAVWHSRLDLSARISLILDVWLMDIKQLPSNTVYDVIYMLFDAKVANRLEKVIEIAAQRLRSTRLVNRIAGAGTS
ncbi:MAG: glycosyltransferase family 2 protein [Thaumarchaeota archaeon]|nr:glycosyltransferase family 2 protein [Nitrososphaerota archaeon]